MVLAAPNVPTQDIEEGCRGGYGNNWNGPKEKQPGEAMKNVWRALVEKHLAAVLPDYVRKINILEFKLTEERRKTREMKYLLSTIRQLESKLERAEYIKSCYKQDAERGNATSHNVATAWKEAFFWKKIVLGWEGVKKELFTAQGYDWGDERYIANHYHLRPAVVDLHQRWKSAMVTNKVLLQLRKEDIRKIQEQVVEIKQLKKDKSMVKDKIPKVNTAEGTSEEAIQEEARANVVKLHTITGGKGGNGVNWLIRLGRGAMFTAREKIFQGDELLQYEVMQHIGNSTLLLMTVPDKSIDFFVDNERFSDQMVMVTLLNEGEGFND